jgi:D-glycero-alpha-D-manno-heptose 1-phosphate guanylyltransferase
MPSMPGAIILCGGAGTRLRGITGDTPKAMAHIADRPFLELLLKQLARNGFGRAVLAVGYRKEAIAAHFGEQAFGLDLTYSPEASPLGTGGALRRAVELVDSDPYLIMNGDSYTDVNLSRLVKDYLEVRADASLVVVPVEGRSDCGSVQIDESGWIERFEEKQSLRTTKYSNAGIYAVSRQLLHSIAPGRQISIERELFPLWLEERRNVRAFIFSGKCIDIGTPERYEIAQRTLASAEVTDDQVQPGHQS